MQLSKKEISDLKKIRSALKRLGRTANSDINSYDLSCACAISAYITFLYFKKRGYKPVFKYSTENFDFAHCWIQFNGYSLDLTATQFDSIYYEEILFLPTSEMRRTHGIYKGASTYTNLSAVRPMFKDWSDSQNPFMLIKTSSIVKQIIKTVV